MNDSAYANWITRNDLLSLLTKSPKLFEHMILEAVDDVRFAPFHSDIDLERYDVGRVFGSTCEARWQRDGERFHTLLVGGIAQPPAFLTANHQELSHAAFDYSEREYYLWGEWSEDIPQWVEASIPHIFDYPQPTTYPRPTTKERFRYKLITIEYINRDSGEIEFYRFAGTRQERL